MGGCSSCTLHPLMQDAKATAELRAAAAGDEKVSEGGSSLPDATTCSSDFTDPSDLAKESSGSDPTSLSTSAASSWELQPFAAGTKDPNALAASAAAAARHSLAPQPPQQHHNGPSDSGLQWMPVAPSSCRRRSSSASTASSGSSAASSGASAWPSNQQVARSALLGVLQQVVRLPYGEFLRVAPPDVAASGTPRKSEARLADFGYLASTAPPQVQELLTAALHGAEVDTAILAVNSSRRVWIRNAQGFRPGAFPWCWPAWEGAAPPPQLLVVNDTLAVPSLAAELDGKPPPHVRFFAGIPLVSSSGLALGTLCLAGCKPKSHTAAQCDAFACLAGRVAEQLEANIDATARLQARPQHTLQQWDAEAFVRSTVAASERPLLYVDTARADWHVQFANAPLCQVAGLKIGACVEVPLWQLFQRPFGDDDEAWGASLEVAARGDEFILRSIRAAAAPERGTYSLHFRPADQGELNDDAELKGLPEQMPSAPGNAGHPYFVFVTPEGSRQSCERYTSVPASIASRQASAGSTLIEGLEMGALLGRGSFGHVYRGRYRGRRVAVKVCHGSLKMARGKTIKPWKSVEASQCRKLRHPHIVKAIKHATVLINHADGNLKASSWSRQGSSDERVASSSSSDGWSDAEERGEAAPVDMETVLVMEYCTRGTLKTAIDRGLFCRQQPGGGGGGGGGGSRCCAPDDASRRPDVPVVLHTAGEIAAAMGYLHSRSIVHGDLCATNVLLTASNTLPHGFTSKLADFGMSRELKLQTGMQTASYGTVTHMPPELMLQQQLSPAVDVFSFGVLLWELATASHAWEGMSHTQVIAAVTMEGRRLEFPQGAHPGIVALSARCTSHDPAARPSFAEVQVEIARMQADITIDSR